MKMKKILATGLCAVLITGIALLAGCQQTESQASDPNNQAPDLELGQSVTLFYANEEYIVSGDEELPPLLSYETHLDLGVKNPYKAALDQLMDLPDGGGYATFLGSLMIKEVEVDGGTAIVDFDGHELEGGSSMTETFLIDQIVMTLVASFEEIDNVHFEVDGQEVESLMGHLEIDGLLTVTETASGELLVVPAE